MQPRGQEERATEACRRFDAELEGYLEGDAAPHVVRHARECAFCGTLLADLEQIRRVSRDLPVDEPPAALWANVRAALVMEGIIHEPVNLWRRWFSSRFWLKPVPIAAAACIAVVVIALVAPRRGVIQTARNDSGTLTTGTMVPPPEFQSLASAVDDMEKNYRAQEASFDPQVKASYEKGLESLDGEINECLSSVQREPANAAARQYLMAAYSEKAQVLQSALEFNGR